MPKEAERLTARQVISLFIEADTWVPIMDDISENRGGPDDTARGDGVVCGMGSFNGRQICIYVQDMDVHFGTIAELHGRKVVRTIELAIENKCPVIGVIQTGGARIQQGPVSLAAASAMARKIIEASGYIPSIAIVIGPGAGGGAYMTSLSDFAIMNKSGAYMFLTGPRVVKKVLNETVTEDELGGIEAHFRHSGIVSHQADHILDARDTAGRILEHLPSWCGEMIHVEQYLAGPSDDRPALENILPDLSQQAYDMETVLEQLLDKGSLFEHHGGFARNVITGFGRLGNRSIGIVANQPAVMGGVLDTDCTRKIGRFVQICDAYNVPLLFVVDCPGYLPGRSQEWAGVIGKGAFMAHLISQSTVPKVTLIVRKAIGGAYATMNSDHLGGDFSLAWTKAEISVVGMDAALDILLKSKLGPDAGSEEVLQAARDQYRDDYLNPYLAASRGLIDKVIRPSESRAELIRIFNRLESKARSPRIKKKRSILPFS